jgi:tetratricopeptide (TPR) repeat protein
MYNILDSHILFGRSLSNSSKSPVSYFLNSSHKSFSFALALQLLGKYEEAKKYYEKVLALDPNNEVALNALNELK